MSTVARREGKVAALVRSALARWRRWSLLRGPAPPDSGVAIAPTSALGELLAQSGLQLVDIGARGSALPQLKVLAPFAQYFACEPDRGEAAMLQERLRAEAQWRQVTIIPEALSSVKGSQVLHLTVQPGLSSLLKPNRDVVTRYYGGAEFDITHTISVPTISLDQAAERYGFGDACFLKLDTQGTELDILQSGSGLLRKAVLCLYLEVEFQPFYARQPLFAEVDQYLRGHGFTLVGLERTLLRRRSFRPDLYSRREVVWAHALYVRQPEVLNEGEGDAWQRVARLLAVALAFEHYDLALEMLNMGPMATKLRTRFGEGLVAEVEAVALRRTCEMERLSREWREVTDLTGFAYRDRKMPW